MSFEELLSLGILVLICAIVIYGLAGKAPDFHEGMFNAQRAMVDRAFERRVLAKPELGLDPSTVRLVHDIESVLGRPSAYQSSRLYCNSEGDYFLFVCTAGEEGSLLPLSRERAARMVKPYKAVHDREFGRVDATRM
jgi:hypothetical protein